MPKRKQTCDVLECAIIDAAMNCGMTRAKTCRMLADLRNERTDEGQHVRTSRAKEVHAKINEVQTPHGPLIQEMDVVCENNKTYTIEFAQPLALLFHLNQQSDQASQFFYQQFGTSGRGSVVIYCDECRIGNPLRPDKGRTIQNVCWTFKEYPEWYNNRVQWYPFAIFPSKWISGHDMSIFFCSMMRKFFPENSIENGGLVLTCGSVDFLLTLQFGFCLQDGKSIAETASLTGSSGRKPCPCCRNVVGRVPPVQVASDPYLVTTTMKDDG